MWVQIRAKIKIAFLYRKMKSNLHEMECLAADGRMIENRINEIIEKNRLLEVKVTECKKKLRET